MTGTPHRQGAGGLPGHLLPMPWTLLHSYGYIWKECLPLSWSGHLCVHKQCLGGLLTKPLWDVLPCLLGIVSTQAPKERIWFLYYVGLLGGWGALGTGGAS